MKFSSSVGLMVAGLLVELRQLCVAGDPELNVRDVLDPPEAGHLHLGQHVVRVPVVARGQLAGESFEQPAT